MSIFAGRIASGFLRHGADKGLALWLIGMIADLLKEQSLDARYKMHNSRSSNSIGMDAHVTEECCCHDSNKTYWKSDDGVMVEYLVSLHLHNRFSRPVTIHHI